MKTKFKDFLLEATLKGSPAFSNDYLDQYTQFMRQRYQGQAPREFMQSLDRMMRLQTGHEPELEDIAKRIIKEFYGSILDGIELDTKIIKPGDDEQMEMSSKMSFDKPPKFEIKTVEDEEIKLEIDKKKIINNIVQGESFNTFKLFQLAKDEIDEINPDLYELYNKIVEESYTLYWRMPEQQQVDMIRNAPQYGNYFQLVYKEDVLNDEEDENDEQKEPLDKGGDVTIKVRALDMAALIHEMVKGVYELISQRGIPQDREISQIVLTNTESYWDEIEDLRYGPKIASDLRDFMNQNPKTNTYPNVREFVFGYMVDPNIIPNDEFIELIKGILTNTPEARRTIDSLIDKSIEELKDYDEQPKEIEEPKEETDEEGLPDIDFSQYFKKPQTEVKPEPESKPEIKKLDYTKLTEPDFRTEYAKMEIQVNKLLDDNDMENVKVVSSEMKKLKDEFQKKYNKEFVPRKLKI